MKVKILGFELIPAKGVGLAELFQHFEATNGQLRGDRIVGVTSKDGFWIGVLLSIKDAKAFCRFRTQGTSFKVHPEGLGNDRIVDFNYFAISQATGRGLYQHYHQSAALNTFCLVLRQQYKALSKQRHDEESAGADEQTLRRLAEKYSGFLNYQIMCRKETLQQKVQLLARVKNIQFDYTALEVNNSDELAPLLSVAKKRTERLTFSKTNADLVKQSIIKFLESYGLKKLSLQGIDPDGHEQTYKLFNDHDNFEDFDYDGVLETIDIDSQKLVAGLVASPLMAKILAVANRPAINALLTMPAP